MPRPSIKRKQQAPEESFQGGDFLHLLAILQALRVNILPISWEKARHHFGGGGTSHINQTVVNAKDGIAFKWIRGDKISNLNKAYKIAAQEIGVLSQPCFQKDPGIVTLHGICWHIEDEKVWPVLVFEKSKFGDLFQFAQSEVGRSLGMQERVKICMEIGRTLLSVHSRGMFDCPTIVRGSCFS